MTAMIRRAALGFAVAAFAVGPAPGIDAGAQTPDRSAAVPAASPSEEEQRARSDELYRAAQRELLRQDHAKALALLREYLEYTRTAPHRPERVFWVIDQVGRIYLSRQRDPDAAIAFFSEMRGDERLSDLDRQAIDEWVATARDWQTTRQELDEGLTDAAQLLSRGTRYFKGGVSKIESAGLATFASADLNIAAGYLRRFAILYSNHARIGDVLYMLGAIRHYSQRDQEYWSDNYYLKEVIRRFPHTELATRAFKLLRDDVLGAYRPGSIPPDLAENLALYEELARPQAPLQPQAP